MRQTPPRSTINDLSSMKFSYRAAAIHLPANYPSSESSRPPLPSNAYHHQPTCTTHDWVALSYSSTVLVSSNPHICLARSTPSHGARPHPLSPALVDPSPPQRLDWRMGRLVTSLTLQFAMPRDTHHLMDRSERAYRAPASLCASITSNVTALFLFPLDIV
ncbi:hypothetical protein DL93DRAFT_2090832 [Clavulina sp. PMI_390]|nr:hypothetical protein DL93DRAFT_2090832 [Clavulina sp. PMI_390]